MRVASGWELFQKASYGPDRTPFIIRDHSVPHDVEKASFKDTILFPENSDSRKSSGADA
jgi:hypothetical protein